MEERILKSHKISLFNRSSGIISGVKEVISFDPNEIILDTEQGMLMIQGEELHVTKLTVEKGEVEIEGLVYSMVYSDDGYMKGEKGGLLRRLFHYMENKKIADIIIKQIHLFFISGLYGILLGLWYEFFRTLRKNFVHKNKMVHLEDVIFCFTAAIGLFILFQVYNQGMVRFYCLVGLECGAVFYFLVLSEVIGKLFSVFIKIISKIVKITGGIILFPGKVIVKNTGKMLKNMRRTVKIIRRNK